MSQHIREDQFSISFSVLVAEKYSNDRSDAAQTAVDHTDLPQYLKINLTVSCEETDVIASWRLIDTQRHDDINGYCIQYQCDTLQQLIQTVSCTHSHSDVCIMVYWSYIYSVPMVPWIDTAI